MNTRILKRIRNKTEYKIKIKKKNYRYVTYDTFMFWHKILGNIDGYFIGSIHTLLRNNLTNKEKNILIKRFR